MEELLAGHSNTCAQFQPSAVKTGKADHKTRRVEKGSVRENSTKEAGTAKGLVQLKKEKEQGKQAGKKVGEILPQRSVRQIKG